MNPGGSPHRSIAAPIQTPQGHTQCNGADALSPWRASNTSERLLARSHTLSESAHQHVGERHQSCAQGRQHE